MARSPNAEQKLAIEHTGGVLLRAGAGSGKTFVLVEHIVYLTRLWMREYLAKPEGQFEDFLRQKYSKVVMMTFTKKAAGEMSIRMAERFEELMNIESDEQRFWIHANELLPSLMATTIDGFCKKLITLGYFPHLSTESQIIFDTERTDQVRELVQEWFETSAEKLDPVTHEIVIKEKENILKAFTHVFSNPGLRLEWKKFRIADIDPKIISDLLRKSFKLNEIEDALAPIHALELDEEKKRSAFEKVIATFQSSGLPKVESLEQFKVYTALFAPITKLPYEATKSKKSPASDAAKKGLEILRDWVVEWDKVINDYQTHFEGKVKPWMEFCLEIFNYIEGRLDPNLGMTFGDIEYQVALGLENRDDRERIQKTYSYFIVDEFQDTSRIQFEIISSLIGGDFKKLFCVGDAKQAIYGFRGGELSVFEDCADYVPTKLSLANNYRSLAGVIEFNNSLFRAILPLGFNFKGHDSFSVKAEDQNVPAETLEKETGGVEILSAKLERDPEEEGKFKTHEINKIEATLIADSIQKERQSSNNVCTVLYSKMTPSGELIRALMERKIGFTAQYKIELKDDPILGIFVTLLRRQFDANPETKNKFPLFMIENYFKIMGLPINVSAEDLEHFEMGVSYWGLVESFRKFLHRLHITNENSDINLENIETLAGLYHQDPESIMSQLRSTLNGDKVKLELRSGENSHMVQLMTAHASKGLEFDSVYLAGIYTNGKDRPDSSLFGDLPGSFNWYMDIQTRKKQKSPLYLYENDLARYKDFSEAKRLFYVACTRAKKKLLWVDLDLPVDTFSIPPNSWVLALTAWSQTSKDFKHIQVSQNPEFDPEKLLTSQNIPQLPLFFHDPAGIFSKGEGKSELLISGELSVTRLNALVDCPRKFYLSNILKITEPVKEKKVFVEEEGEELATVIRSSSERGTYIHEKIAKGIEHNFVVPRDVFGTELQKPVQWALELLKPKAETFNLIPEKQIKFKFFNFMISGIPDLLLLPKSNHKAQVWDFKTGKITPSNLSHYWTQLSAYAYALYELGIVGPTEEIELVLCFVDQEKLLEQTVNKQKVEADLYPLWRSQNEPWKTNPDHCAQCSYGSICPR